MGFLTRAVTERKGAGSVWERWLQMMDHGSKSKAGASINHQTIWRNSVALACVRARANGVAQVPFKLYRERDEGGLKRIEPARDHELYDLMATKPNGWQTSFEFRQQLEVHLSLGNAYAFLNRYRGKIAEVFILCGVRAEQQEDRSTRYWVRGKSGVEQEVPAANIWHLRGLSWDGFLGMDMLNAAREALGLAVALEESAAGLHSNGVRPSGVYSVDGSLSPEQHKKLVDWLKKEATAPGGTMVLDRNAKWLTTAMTSIDAQHKEMRDQQTEEICRFFGVSPHKVFHSDKTSTYASAEQFNIQHVVDCLMPEYASIEQSADANLLTAEERKKGYYFKFNANGLLRGSTKDRGEYYARALGSGGHPGWMSPDEVRGLEEMNPMGGEAAKLPPASSAKPPAPSADPAN
jgi:HK97 family phage portal protein